MATLNSNLPADSQPWGREVDTRLTSLENAIDANAVNDAARDKQLRSSLARVADLTHANEQAIDYLNDQSTYVAIKPLTSEGTWVAGTGGALTEFNHNVPGFKFVITIDKPKIMTLRHNIACSLYLSNKGAGFYYGAVVSGFILNGNVIDSSDFSSDEISFAVHETFTSTSSTDNSSNGTVVNEFALILPAGTHTVQATTTVKCNLPGSTANELFYTLKKEVFSATVNSNSVIIPDASVITDTSTEASSSTGGGSTAIGIAGLRPI